MALAHIRQPGITPLNLDDAERAILLTETIARDRVPLSPRIKSLRAILAKLEPSKPARRRSRR